MFVFDFVVAVFEVAMEFQIGRVSIKDSLINMLKGLMAVSLFTIFPRVLHLQWRNSQILMVIELSKNYLKI